MLAGLDVYFDRAKTPISEFIRKSLDQRLFCVRRDLGFYDWMSLIFTMKSVNDTFDFGGKIFFIPK